MDSIKSIGHDLEKILEISRQNALDFAIEAQKKAEVQADYPREQPVSEYLDKNTGDAEGNVAPNTYFISGNNARAVPR